MNIPRTTYRVQFHNGFNFHDFEHCIDYLRQLGIDTIYASPILKAVSGSTHGYDGTDTQLINPELGTIDQLRTLKQRLNQQEIKWLQDIVPNHMAYHSDNTWMMDVLLFGARSRYATYFDTLYSNIAFKQDKLMVPILGTSLEETIRAHELTVVLLQDEFQLAYFDNRLPIRPSSLLFMLHDLLPSLTPDPDELCRRIATLEANGDTDGWKTLQSELISRLSSRHTKAKLRRQIAMINASEELITELLAQQHYRPCHWQETDQQINFRRFFTVNGLICLNIQDRTVFRETHQLVKELLQEEIIDGLRIDHIDGLHNPRAYLSDLRRLCGPDTYIVAEKILEHHEKLPKDWPIQGTTGYDFLALCNNVCTDRKSKKLLTDYYQRQTGNKDSIKQQQLQKKTAVLANHMQGEVDNLCTLFSQLSLSKVGTTIQQNRMRETIQAFLANFPVYRLYDDRFPLAKKSYQMIVSVFETMSENQRKLRQEIKILKKIVQKAQSGIDENYSEKVLSFLMRCMQFTGPAMAKGVEDTLMYTYNRFIGHNEVGDHPAYFGIRKSAFHRAMRKRQEQWPLSLNASATHDTKRGEDVRSRLHVLTAWPKGWITQVDKWQAIVQQQYEKELPHPNDVYFIYQALIGSYPMPGTPVAGFEGRFHAYLSKYLREGKERSDWALPNEAYEARLQHFASFLLDQNGAFHTAFYPFFEQVADFGIMNSLTQQVLKFTCPGVPDVYQGTELWDLSFVDPDNRRAVDYATRASYLTEIDALDADVVAPMLWAERYNGKIKLWLIRKLVALRQESSALFTHGEYIPLEVKGAYRRHVLAFARRYGRTWIVIAVPLHLAGIPALREDLLSGLDWGNTRIILPCTEALKWEHLLTSETGESAEIRLDAVFNKLPLAILKGEEASKPRGAGILMHISSLPSKFGMGDLGKNAFQFARHLRVSGQRWWQVLPLAPLSKEQYYSPYSTFSALAGNPLFIDLEALAQDGLLRKKELKKGMVKPSGRVNYPLVESLKTALLDKAFERVNLESIPAFQQFCEDEQHWLQDYALFTALRKKHLGTPWYTWPSSFKARETEALHAFEIAHEREIQKQKWFQYIFFKQWHELRQHCHSLGIQFLGDVPIYVGHDSADVWAHPHLFSLETDGSLKAVAGVPPDYFNADGQLWGMPVFDWQALKREGYQWWIDRLAHNRRLYDKVRLDHFRAFAAYWEVSAKEATAKNGIWQEAPGSDFFNMVQSALGEMPFIAEDLGDIDDAVYRLRDAHGLPGMKVLQFAFGEDIAHSPHVPHNYNKNYVVYTGTHDNNTLQGWFQDELDEASKGRLSQYVAFPLQKTTINDTLIRMAYASVADTAIVPMQDILALDGSHRMNSPASISGNWGWRMLPDAFDKHIRKKLKQFAHLYGR
ncbi:malto-oligosyltrehalose synthase [Sphingobacterium pedocola]|nr:malto-oligosyltrehalose synthase [Sphingobacterium pedocola]